MLVDAGLVREGVLADDRLVGLELGARDAAHALARRVDLRRVDAGVGAEERVARLERHHDLLERGVAGALADAVEAALDLRRAAADRGEGVGDREPEVVVAVAGEDDVRRAGDAGEHVAEEVLVFLRHREADGVRHVDRRRAGLDRGLHDAVDERPLGAGAVLQRELDVLAERAGVLHALDRGLDDGVRRHPELALHVERRGGDEDVDARMPRVLHGLPGAVDVGLAAAGERRDDGLLRRARERLHGLEVAGRGRGEAGLDDVDAERLQVLKDEELVGEVHRAARGLLAVAEGGVEDSDALGLGVHVAGFELKG